jgi:TonB family protein
MTTIAKALSIVLVLIFAETGTAQEQPVRLFPITDVVPAYPTDAVVQEVKGWVLVSLDVSARGAISNIRVLDAEPGSIFDQSAIEAAQHLRFEPYTENNIARDVSGVQYIFRFELSELTELEVPDNSLSLNDAALASRSSRSAPGLPSVSQLASEDMLPVSTVLPVYPTDAQKQGIGGWVLLRFALSDNGDVLNPVVEESDPSGLFDESALNAIRNFRYEAWNPLDGNIERLNVFHLFKYRPL